MLAGSIYFRLPKKFSTLINNCSINGTLVTRKKSTNHGETTMIKLNNSTLDSLPPSVTVPGYDRSKLKPGIAHFSVGNFHRAHQADYLDRLLASGGHDNWALLGIGLMDDPIERRKAQAFKQQDGLYTLTVCPPKGPSETRVIGSIVEYLCAPEDPTQVLNRLCDPNIRIVTMTLTEGGYNIDAKTNKFKMDAPDIVHDLANRGQPRTAFGYVAEALTRRKAQGIKPFTILSCDNLQHNGDVAKKCFTSFARGLDTNLADWMEHEIDFPNSMVDRITPATTDADRTRLNTVSGVDDLIPVFTEDFIQWVMQDQFMYGRPNFESVDVQMTKDVWAYEQIKLRMLNASHSMLGFPGVVAGYKLVHETCADPLIKELLMRFWDRDVIPLLTAPPGMSLNGYRDKLLERYLNPAIRDQVLRLATDGASRIPIFVGDTIREVIAKNGDISRLAFLLAAVAQHLGGVDDKGHVYRTPEPSLTEAERELASDPDPIKFLSLRVFAGLGMDTSTTFITAFEKYKQSIKVNGTLATLKDVLAQSDK